LLSSYFNIKSPKLNKDDKAYNLKRVFVSTPEIKYSINSVNVNVYVFNKERLILLNKINKIKNNETNKNLNTFFNKFDINNSLMMNNLNTEIITKVLYNKYYKLYLYKLYINNLYLNKFKFNHINMINLKNILYNMYNKNIRINIINLKYLYLDNSLFMDAIVRKLKDRNRKALVMLRKAFALVNIPIINSIFLLKIKKNIKRYSYNLINYKEYLNIKKIKLNVFESLKNTHMIGIRLIGKGRLTRRLTASRAILKRTYIGNLKNIYSTFRGLPTTTSRGFEKSNLNYVNGNSYNRNGSFGIKS
jgi:hypothetical protein